MTKWKWVALPVMAMLLLSLLPQVHLWLIRGRNWNGAYVSSQGDELLYSAYINALIEGRPRKNDPFAGRDSTSKSPVSESTFSIQFIPPYVISFLARMFGASASTAMIALIAAAGFLASLSVFWLLNTVLGDYRLAAAGTLFVLCLGGAASGSGLLGIILNFDLGMPLPPFLRRYQPAAAFPLFFVLNTLVWRSLTSQTKPRLLKSIVLGGVTLVILIFSYLYLWTAAVAWVGCIGVLWFYFRPSDRRKTSAMLGAIVLFISIALVPYAYLVSARPPTLDEQQTLTITHQVDLFRGPEILGMLILVAIVIGVRRGRIQMGESSVIYATSLAILPFVLFNQQVITGRSMQPHHFAAFIANYAVLVGLVIGAVVLWKTISLRVLVWVAAVALSWGFVEVALPARLGSVPLAVADDELIPVLMRLRQLSMNDRKFASVSGSMGNSALVFSPHIRVSLLLPTWTSQGTLLDMGGLDFGSVSREERKEFFFMHLYYCNADAMLLRNSLKGVTADIEQSHYARSVIFGHERVLTVLSHEFQPIQPAEIEREVQQYQVYISSFSREEVMKRSITYAVIPVEGNFDFTNLDRWYERDAGERVGDYTLYRLKLRE